MLLRCAIIDDDEVFSKTLEHYLEKIDFMEPAGIFPDAEAASKDMDLSKVDLIFLDVEMPGMSGLEFLKKIPNAPPVIVVSAKKEYGVEAFDLDCIDYLYKPVSYARFLKAASKARKFFEQTNSHQKINKDSLYIRQDRMWIRIPVNDIFYVKADDNDVIIKVSDKSYKTHAKLSYIFNMLPHKDFMQVHRSYLVSLPKIEKIDGEIIEINARTIPVSKSHVKELHERLNIV